MVTNTRANLAANHRHSLDAKQGSPAPVRRDVTGLRQEQSSPAVVQPAGDCSLLKAVVSASGQGAPALLHAAGNNSNKAIWRSRCVQARIEPELVNCCLCSRSSLLCILLTMLMLLQVCAQQTGELCHPAAERTVQQRCYSTGKLK